MNNSQMVKYLKQVKKREKDLTHITDKSKLSVEDKMKMSLCKHFVRYAVTKNLKLKQVAKLIGIPVPRMSEIVNYKITKFKVDQLLKNLSALAEHDASAREYLVFLNQAVETPFMPVAKTRELTRNLKEVSASL